jgi:hypothetical protein
MSGGVSVRGGSHSISVEFAQLRALAADFRQARLRLGSTASTALATLADPALVVAGVLDPAGAIAVVQSAAATAAIATAAGLGCDALAGALIAAAGAYERVDELDGRIEPLLRAATAFPRLVSSMTSYRPGLPPDQLAAAVNALRSDPALAAFGISGGWDLDPVALLCDLSSPGRGGSRTSALAGLLTLPFRDGHPVLLRRPGDPTDDGAGPPRNLTDLIRGVEVRNDNTHGGAVDVRIVTTANPDGSTHRSAIVNITGTTTWNPKPVNPTVSNTGTNLRGVANLPTTYEAGVILALQDAAVRPDEPILLVGHSQGGIVAAQLAADLAESRDFRVTHVVTAGAPIGLVDVPKSVQVMSFENAGDLVPDLDGTDNPTRPNQITVKIDRGGTGLGQRHDLQSGYLPGAVDADASDDPSIRDWLAGASAFLDGDAVTTTVYQVGRKP